MSERLRFEREMKDLGLSESQEASSELEQKNEGILYLDFYDRVAPHLEYLGSLYSPAKQDAWEIRLINRTDLIGIYSANRKISKSATISDFAISMPRTYLENKLFPQGEGTAVGLQSYAYDYKKIAAQSRLQSLLVQIDDEVIQKKQLNDLFKTAKDTEKEQGVYIVVEVLNQENKARLYFLRALPITSARDEFTFALGKTEMNGKKIMSVPGARNKQVIGTVHTHYLKTAPRVEQTTTISHTMRFKDQVSQRIEHAVSDLDINSAKENQYIVYAIEDKQLHKALPTGKAINGLKRTFNVLTDALESFAGKQRH